MTVKHSISWKVIEEQISSVLGFRSPELTSGAVYRLGLARQENGTAHDGARPTRGRLSNQAPLTRYSPVGSLVRRVVILQRAWRLRSRWSRTSSRAEGGTSVDGAEEGSSEEKLARVGIIAHS
jgi:hypothetical protein